MKSYSLQQLKNELSSLSPSHVQELCLRLAKYKKENKELLGYLLFEAPDEESYVNEVKGEIERLFDEINQSNLYYTRKGLRKVLRHLNKHIKYSGNRQSELELRLCFCLQVKHLKTDWSKSTVIQNMYGAEQKKIERAMQTLHEDLQYDYRKQLDQLI